MVETGLIMKWKSQFVSMPYQCLDKSERQQKEIEIRYPDKIRLSNLTSVFGCLLVGCILAFITFLAEMMKRNTRRHTG